MLLVKHQLSLLISSKPKRTEVNPVIPYRSLEVLSNLIFRNAYLWTEIYWAPSLLGQINFLLTSEAFWSRKCPVRTPIVTLQLVKSLLNWLPRNYFLVFRIYTGIHASTFNISTFIHYLKPKIKLNRNGTKNHAFDWNHW